MNSPRISIHIVTWNSLTYLPACIRSLREQSFRDWTCLVVDNASTDGSVAWLRTNAPEFNILQNRQNMGFARAHNQAIHISRSPYVLTLNPDVILTPNFLEKLYAAVYYDPRIGSASGKLLKFSFVPGELTDPKLSDRIDATGLVIQRSRRTRNRGEGERDQGQYDDRTDVFGVSAAVGLYNREALEDVRIGQEYFDDDFFAYKEDVDLAWRLKRRGWLSRYIPSALAYHHRGVQGDVRSDAATAFQRRHHSRFVNGFSYSNHLAMLVKNESWATFVKDAPWIFWYELKKILFILFFEFSTLRALGRFFRMLPTMLRKRKMIQRQGKTSPGKLRSWFLADHA